MHDRNNNKVSHSQDLHIIIGTIEPCRDLKQRLRKIYAVGIARLEKKKILAKKEPEQ